MAASERRASWHRQKRALLIKNKMALMHQTRLGVLKATRRVAQVPNANRPMSDAASHHKGIDASIPDKALSTYDGIRRSIGH